MEHPLPQRPTPADFRFAAMDIRPLRFRLENPKDKHCYLNAVLFALASMPEFSCPLIKLRSRVLPADSLWAELRAMLVRMEDGGLTKAGPALEGLLGVDEQQDAHEFLLKLVEHGDREAELLAKKKKKKGKKKKAPEDEWTGVAKGGKAVAVETVGGDADPLAGPFMSWMGVLHKKTVSRGGARVSLEPAVGISVEEWGDISRVRLAQLPPMLVMHCPRVARRNGTLARGNDDVSVGVDLHADEAVGHYILHAVVLHSGRTLHSGHYTARVRQGQGWVHCDDAAPPAVCAGPTEGLPPGSYPYLLFYRRQ